MNKKQAEKEAREFAARMIMNEKYDCIRISERSSRILVMYSEEGLGTSKAFPYNETPCVTVCGVKFWQYQGGDANEFLQEVGALVNKEGYMVDYGSIKKGSWHSEMVVGCWRSIIANYVMQKLIESGVAAVVE